MISFEAPRRLDARRESELTAWLFDEVLVTMGALDFVLGASLGHYLRGWTIEVWLNLERKYLQLDPREKPGDFDLLLVPVVGGDRIAERAIAIEVKRSAVPKNNRGKSPNSFGTEQAFGLLRDGFPFCAILHLIFVERSNRDRFLEVPLHETGVRQIGDDGQIGTMKIDPDFIETQFRSVGKLEKEIGQNSIGYNVQTYDLDESGLHVVGRSVSSARPPILNVNRDRTLLENIRALSVPPELRLVFHYGGIDIRWRDRFLEPSPRDGVRA